MDFLIRNIPIELHNKIRQRAQQNNSTMVDEIITILQWATSEQPILSSKRELENVKRELDLHKEWVRRVAHVFKEIGFKFGGNEQ